MTSAPRSARWVVRLPGPSIETSTTRRPARGAGRFTARKLIREQQPHLIVSRVGHAAFDRVGAPIQETVGKVDERARELRVPRRLVGVEVRADDLEARHGAQRRIDVVDASRAFGSGDELRDLAVQTRDLFAAAALFDGGFSRAFGAWSGLRSGPRRGLRSQPVV